jgi:hypothetical protein
MTLAASAISAAKEPTRSGTSPFPQLWNAGLMDQCRQFLVILRCLFAGAARIFRPGLPRWPEGVVPVRRARHRVAGRRSGRCTRLTKPGRVEVGQTGSRLGGRLPNAAVGRGSEAASVGRHERCSLANVSGSKSPTALPAARLQEGSPGALLRPTTFAPGLAARSVSLCKQSREKAPRLRGSRRNSCAGTHYNQAAN